MTTIDLHDLANYLDTGADGTGRTGIGPLAQSALAGLARNLAGNPGHPAEIALDSLTSYLALTGAPPLDQLVDHLPVPGAGFRNVPGDVGRTAAALETLILGYLAS